MSDSFASSQNWYQKRLSREQAAAVLAAADTTAILASAGSGKTTTLVHALVNEIVTGTPPSEITAFTFTKKAAEELRTRTHLLLREVSPSTDVAALSIGTIHGWCFDYLLRNPKFYNFSPLDEDIQVYALVARLYDRLGLQKAYGLPFPGGIVPFLKDLEIYFNECVEPGSVPEKIRSPIDAFESVLDENRLLTFGAMIRFATAALESTGPVDGLSKLFVDEYQDVNPAQVRLIKAMLPHRAKVVVVGDDLQCIYNWRGSDVTRIINFPSEFDAAAPSVLTENYRSRPTVVDLCNAVAENIVNRFPKEMRSKLEGRQGAVVHHRSFASEHEQASEIARLVGLFHDRGTPYSAIAILLRSVSSAGRPILDALIANGIPVNCPLQRGTGGFLDEFLLPLFRWLQEDHAEPKNEVEEQEAERSTDTLWKSVFPWLRGSAKDPKRFWIALGQWGSALSRNISSAYDVRGSLYDFLKFCGIELDIKSSEIAVSLGIASQIIRAVEEIHRRRIVGSSRKSAKGIVREVYFGLRDLSDTVGESLPVEAPSDAVLITTVHQSKGLEWPVVILGTLNKNRFPVRESSAPTSFPVEISKRYGTATEDEWRLFYVACSRARERLYLFDFAGQDEKKQSVFIGKLRSHLGDKEKDGAAWDGGVATTISAEDLKRQERSTVAVGFSDAAIYSECPFQYALRRLVQIQPSIDDNLGYGQSIHEIAQRRANNRKAWSQRELEEAINNFVHLPYVGDKQLEVSKVAIKYRIEALEKAGAFKHDVRPEVDVEVAFPRGIVSGVIDSVISDGARVGVSDWKTNIHPEFLARYAEQLRFYAYALEQRGERADFAQLVDIGRTFDTGALSVVSVDLAPEKVRATVDKISLAVAGIADRKFEPSPSTSACKACDMSRLCRYRIENGNA